MTNIPALMALYKKPLVILTIVGNLALFSLIGYRLHTKSTPSPSNKYPRHSRTQTISPTTVVENLEQKPSEELSVVQGQESNPSISDPKSNPPNADPKSNPPSGSQESSLSSAMSSITAVSYQSIAELLPSVDLSVMIPEKPEVAVVQAVQLHETVAASENNKKEKSDEGGNEESIEDANIEQAEAELHSPVKLHLNEAPIPSSNRQLSSTTPEKSNANVVVEKKDNLTEDSFVLVKSVKKKRASHNSSNEEESETDHLKPASEEVVIVTKKDIVSTNKIPSPKPKKGKLKVPEPTIVVTVLNEHEEVASEDEVEILVTDDLTPEIPDLSVFQSTTNNSKTASRPVIALTSNSIEHEPSSSTTSENEETLEPSNEENDAESRNATAPILSEVPQVPLTSVLENADSRLTEHQHLPANDMTFTAEGTAVISEEPNSPIEVPLTPAIDVINSSVAELQNSAEIKANSSVDLSLSSTLKPRVMKARNAAPFLKATVRNLETISKHSISTIVPEASTAESSSLNTVNMKLVTTKMVNSAQDLSLVVSAHQADQINHNFIKGLYKVLQDNSKQKPIFFPSRLSPNDPELLKSLMIFSKEQNVFKKDSWEFEDAGLELTAISANAPDVNQGNYAFIVFVDQVEKPKSSVIVEELENVPKENVKPSLTREITRGQQYPRRKVLFMFDPEQNSNTSVKIIIRALLKQQHESAQPQLINDKSTIIAQIDDFMNESRYSCVAPSVKEEAQAPTIQPRKRGNKTFILNTCLLRMLAKSKPQVEDAKSIGNTECVGKPELGSNAMNLLSPATIGNPRRKHIFGRFSNLIKSDGCVSAWMIAPFALRVLNDVRHESKIPRLFGSNGPQTTEEQAARFVESRSMGAGMTILDDKPMGTEKESSLVIPSQHANCINQIFIGGLSKILRRKTNPFFVKSSFETRLLSSLFNFSKRQNIFKQNFWMLKDAQLEIEAIRRTALTKEFVFLLLVDEGEEPKSSVTVEEVVDSTENDASGTVNSEPKRDMISAEAKGQQPKKRGYLLFDLNCDHRAANIIIIRASLKKQQERETAVQPSPEFMFDSYTLLNEVRKFILEGNRRLAIHPTIEGSNKRASSPILSLMKRKVIINTCLSRMLDKMASSPRNVSFIGKHETIGKMRVGNDAMVLFTQKPTQNVKEVRLFNGHSVRLGSQLSQISKLSGVGSGWMLASFGLKSKMLQDSSIPRLMPTSAPKISEQQAVGFVFVIVLKYARLLNMPQRDLPNVYLKAKLDTQDLPFCETPAQVYPSSTMTVTSPVRSFFSYFVEAWDKKPKRLFAERNTASTMPLSMRNISSKGFEQVIQKIQQSGKDDSSKVRLNEIQLVNQERVKKDGFNNLPALLDAQPDLNLVDSMKRDDSWQILSQLSDTKELSLVVPATQVDHVNHQFIQELSKIMKKANKSLSHQSLLSFTEKELLGSLISFTEGRNVFKQDSWTFEDGFLEIKAVPGASESNEVIFIFQIVDEPKSSVVVEEVEDEPESSSISSKPKKDTIHLQAVPKKQRFLIFGSEDKFNLSTKIILKVNMTRQEVQPHPNAVLLNEVEEFMKLRIPSMIEPAPKDKRKIPFFVKGRGKKLVLKSGIFRMLEKMKEEPGNISFVGKDKSVGKLELGNEAMILFAPKPNNATKEVRLFNGHSIRLSSGLSRITKLKSVGSGWITASIPLSREMLTEPHIPRLLTPNGPSLPQVQAAGFIFIVVLNYVKILNLQQQRMQGYPNLHVSHKTTIPVLPSIIKSPSKEVRRHHRHRKLMASATPSPVMSLFSSLGELWVQNSKETSVRNSNTIPLQPKRPARPSESPKLLPVQTHLLENGKKSFQ